MYTCLGMFDVSNSTQNSPDFCRFFSLPVSYRINFARCTSNFDICTHKCIEMHRFKTCNVWRLTRNRLSRPSQKNNVSIKFHANAVLICIALEINDFFFLLFECVSFHTVRSWDVVTRRVFLPVAIYIFVL